MIDVTHLTKKFGERAAISDLSFSVQPGVVTGFLGPNGSGKSTLLEAIAVACGFHAEGGSRNFRFKRAPRTRHCTKIWSSTSASPA